MGRLVQHHQAALKHRLPDARRLRAGLLEQPRHNRNGKTNRPTNPGRFIENIARRRGRKTAIVAIARKLLTLCYYGLRDGEIRNLNHPGPSHDDPDNPSSELACLSDLPLTGRPTP